MKKATLVAIVSIGLLMPAVAAVSRAGHVPPNSYLRKPVSSVEELAVHINSDPVVRNRFARHFGIPPDRLTAYIKENVVITRVNKSTPRSIYIVTRDGRMIAQRKVLKQGTAVFALRDTGEPLLVLSCGNPVLKQLPPRERVKSEKPQVYEMVRPNEAPLPPAMAMLPPPPMTGRSPAPLGHLAERPLAPSTSVPVVTSRGALPWPLLGGLLINNGDGEQPPAPPPIPEPGGAAAVAAATAIPAAGWAIRKLALRRSSTSSD